jgi:phage terminase large subunit GpA-like protein
MVPFGANNANKMRMFSIQWLLKDELDAWPDIVGHDGEPDALSDARCSAYWERRKIFRGSTPLEAHRSKIAQAFKRGDQRYYYVRCLSCGFPQVMRWNGINKRTGHTYGITWEMEGDQLILDSVRWVCAECGHAHHEHDKTLLFSEANGAEWRPTAIPRLKDIRSYHLSALYSPDGFQPWYKCVSSYLEGWDVEKKILKNSGKFQEFYNNVLGETYTVLGDRLTFSTVSALRRPAYVLGEIPNEHAIEFAGGKIEMVILTVDMQKSFLAVGTFGFTPKKCCYLLDYWRFSGDTLNSQNPDTWGEVRKLIENKVYVDHAGREYPIALSLIDSSYSTGIVNEFCSGYINRSVYPVMGREEPPKRAANREFWAFETNAGTTGYGIIVDIYKDTLSMALRRYWDGVETQPHGYFNAPVNTPDNVIRELTAESRREKKDPLTLKVVGAEWYRPSGRDNELWDLLVYARCGLDMCAADIWHSDAHLGADKKFPTDWKMVWEYVIENGVYYNLPGK